MRSLALRVLALLILPGIAGAASFTSLGDLPAGRAFSQARGVSNDGSVVVGLASSASGDEAFRWTTGGGMVGLGDLAGGGFASDATGVSASGSVVVGTGSPQQAFRECSQRVKNQGC